MTPIRTAVVGVRGALAVLDKPASLPTEPEEGFAGSALDDAAALLHIRRDRLHAHTRLDVGVSGAVLVSRDDPVRRRIANEPDAVYRRYVGMTAGTPTPPTGAWTSAIGRGRGGSRTIGGSDARQARTNYAVVASISQTVRSADGSVFEPALVTFELETGITHQIRVHAASAGVPLLGDRRYGGPRRFVEADGSVWEMDRIALHALIIDLALDEPWRVLVPPPEELVDLWNRLGGDASDWEHAAE